MRVEVGPRIQQEPSPQTPYNGPGRTDRLGRAPKLRPSDAQVQARPRKLGHVVIGTTDLEPSQRFFMEGIGFKLSDQMMDGAFFLRCSEDHHNVLLQQAPVKFLHHTSWQVEDVDEIGLGAQYLLSKDPCAARLGIRAPPRRLQLLLVLPRPGRQLRRVLLATWTASRTARCGSRRSGKGMSSLYAWGPPPPPSFLRPDDLAELMAGLHSPKG